MLLMRAYTRGMKETKKTVECWECGKTTPNLVSRSAFRPWEIVHIGHLIFCKSCWAVHPWNPKEILKTS